MLHPAHMLASEAFNMLRAPGAAAADMAVRKAWLSSQSRPCKDVVALAMPLRRVPTTLAGFQQALADNNKASDWMISTWYVVHVTAADGREWGWSNAPYDSKKRLPDTKPLYSTDLNGPHAGQTRFWSFKKVSNNMNKGPRVELHDGEDISFVLPAGTTFSHFLREDSYGDNKPVFCVGDGQEYLDPFTPVLLQLSSSNCEQTVKGNGMKLRRVLPVASCVLNSVFDKFFSRKVDLDEAQARASSTKALTSMAKPVAGSPLVCKVDRNAFWFHDEAASVVEILDSGVDPELGGKLLVQESMLLQSLHCTNPKRALRMLTVALGHGAVTCIVAADKTDAAGDCRVVHLHIDTAEALWLNTLQKMRVLDSTELPKSSLLTMCMGSTLADAVDRRSEVLDHIQWYAPSCKVPVATEDGREVHRHVVFEMLLEQRNVEGLREVGQRAFLMDEVAGPHYVIKIYHAEGVQYDPCYGLLCEQPVLLLTWQLRPGMATDAAGALATSMRKRQFVAADEKDHFGQEGAMDTTSAKRVRTHSRD